MKKTTTLSVEVTHYEKWKKIHKNNMKFNPIASFEEEEITDGNLFHNPVFQYSKNAPLFTSARYTLANGEKMEYIKKEDWKWHLTIRVFNKNEAKVSNEILKTIQKQNACYIDNDTNNKIIKVEFFEPKELPTEEINKVQGKISENFWNVINRRKTGLKWPTNDEMIARNKKITNLEKNFENSEIMNIHAWVIQIINTAWQELIKSHQDFLRNEKISDDDILSLFHKIYEISSEEQHEDLKKYETEFKIEIKKFLQKKKNETLKEMIKNRDINRKINDEIRGIYNLGKNRYKYSNQDLENQMIFTKYNQKKNDSKIIHFELDFSQEEENNNTEFNYEEIKNIIINAKQGDIVKFNNQEWRYLGYGKVWQKKIEGRTWYNMNYTEGEKMKSTLLLANLGSFADSIWWETNNPKEILINPNTFNENIIQNAKIGDFIIINNTRWRKIDANRWKTETAEWSYLLGGLTFSQDAFINTVKRKLNLNEQRNPTIKTLTETIPENTTQNTYLPAIISPKVKEILDRLEQINTHGITTIKTRDEATNTEIITKEEKELFLPAIIPTQENENNHSNTDAIMENQNKFSFKNLANWFKSHFSKETLQSTTKKIMKYSSEKIKKIKTNLEEDYFNKTPNYIMWLGLMPEIAARVQASLKNTDYETADLQWKIDFVWERIIRLRTLRSEHDNGIGKALTKKQYRTFEIREKEFNVLHRYLRLLQRQEELQKATKDKITYPEEEIKKAQKILDNHDNGIGESLGINNYNGIKNTIEIMKTEIKKLQEK